MKGYTDIEQSKKLAKILPIESADMYYWCGEDLRIGGHRAMDMDYDVPCWSLAALLKYLSEIKPQVYTQVLFPSEGKWILQFAEYGNGNVCEVSCDNPVDACVEMITKLHELKIL